MMPHFDKKNRLPHAAFADLELGREVLGPHIDKATDGADDNR